MIVDLAILKKHIGGIQTKMTFDTVLPFVSIAERNFRRIVGKELFEALPTGNEELLESAEGCIAWAAYDMALPHLKTRIGDLGMAKVLAEKTVAITKWEYVDTREANMEMVDLFWELFWESLETEKPDEWINSAAYIERNKLFLRSADELGKYVPLVGRNRRFFNELQKFIERCEQLYIADTITLPVFLDLKARYQDKSVTLSTIEKALIEKIRFALGFLTLYEAYPYLPLVVDNEGVRQIRKKDGTREEDIADKPYRQAQRQQLWKDAQVYVGQLKIFMNKHSSTILFPEYYLENLTVDDSDEDFTDKSHIII